MELIDIARWIIPYFLIATAFALWDGRGNWMFGYPPDRALLWWLTIARAFIKAVANWGDRMWNGREDDGVLKSEGGYLEDEYEGGIGTYPVPSGLRAAALFNPLPCGGTRKRHLFLKAQFCQRGCGAENPDWKEGTAVPNPTKTVIHAFVGTGTDSTPETFTYKDIHI